jgi:hypothetical protein
MLAKDRCGKERRDNFQILARPHPYPSLGTLRRNIWIKHVYLT